MIDPGRLDSIALAHCPMPAMSVTEIVRDVLLSPFSVFFFFNRSCECGYWNSSDSLGSFPSQSTWRRRFEAILEKPGWVCL